MGLHISDILNNYYNMRLEDRLTLIKKLIKLHEENKYDAGYIYDYEDTLEAIYNIAYYTLKGQKFKDFFEGLNYAQKKELQTQVYITSQKVKTRSWYDIPKHHERLKTMYKPEEEYIKEEKELFVPNFEVLDKEFEDCDGLFCTGISSEKIISKFCRRYYRYANDYELDGYKFTEEEKETIREKYYKPVSNEFNNAIKDSISVIRDNVNESTRTMFDTLDHTQQMYTMFTILSLSKSKLNDCIERRKESRKKILKKQKPSEIRIKCKYGKVTLMEDLGKYETKQLQRHQSKKRKAHTKMKEIKKVNSGYCY